MKIKTEINQKKNVRVHIVSGEFDLDSLFESLAEMYSSLPLQADMNVLWDLRAAEGVGLADSDQLTKVVGLVSDKWGTEGNNKAALVVSRKVDYGLAKLYGRQSSSDVRFFRDIKKAVRWIDQDAH